MKIDNTTPIDQLVNGIGMWEPHDQYDARMAELERRSELAAKYERLTQALAKLVDSARFGVSIEHDGVRGGVFNIDGMMAEHDGTPDSIADAIIKAAEVGR